MEGGEARTHALFILQQLERVVGTADGSHLGLEAERRPFRRLYRVAPSAGRSDLTVAQFDAARDLVLALMGELEQGAPDQAPQQLYWQRIPLLDEDQVRWAIAAPDGTPYSGIESLQNKVIATSYVSLLREFLERNDVNAKIEYFSGAVEIAPKLGKADFICDLVSTGNTLQANGLIEVELLLDSEAVIIQTRAPLPDDKQELVSRILQRLDGVLQVHESKYIMLHAPRKALDEIRRLLPGSEAPTVIPLEGTNDKVAVHAVCRENVFWETLENLKAAGASSLLVLPVEKMLV